MSEAGQDWARHGVAAKADDDIRGFAAGGALLTWDAPAQTAAFMDAGAQALFGAAATLPAATLQRLSLLAGGLASRERMRLEKLRLTSGFPAVLVTCGCKLIAGPDDEPVLALAIPAAELRRLGITPARIAASAAAEAARAPAPAVEAVAPVQTPAAPAPRRGPIRILWTSDAAGALTSLSPALPELEGLAAPDAIGGRPLPDIVAAHAFDPEGGFAQRLAGRATWSGLRLLWRDAGGAEGVKVEFSATPLLDAAREFAGFRGFGLARLNEREPWPAAQPAAVSAPIAAEEAPAPAEAATPPVTAAAEVPAEAEPEVLPDVLETSAPSETPATGAEAHSVAADDEPDASTAPEIEAEAPADADGPFPETDAPVEASDAAAEATHPEASGDEPSDEGLRDEDEDEVLGSGKAASDAEAAEDVAAESDDAEAESEPPPTEDAAHAAEPAPEAEEPASSRTNIVPLRNGPVRPVLEAGKVHLSSAERNAFREIAKALGARIAGEDEAGPRLPPAAPLRLKEGEEAQAATPESDKAAAPDAAEAPRPRLPNSHADVLDRLPVGVLVNRGDEALYANRTLLELLDYADLDDLRAGGSVSRLIKEAARTDGGAMVLIDRTGHLVHVNAVLTSVGWQNEPATLMAFRHAENGGQVKVMTPEEAEEAELAAEFEAEDAESAARVEALRLDVDAREARISELTAMLDTATDGVVTLDERGRMLSLNKAAEALFGYDQREVTGELFTLLFAAESHAPALDYLEGLKGGGVASVLNDGREVAGRVRQGGKIPLFMTMGQIAHGSERRFCAVLRDITAWKKTESELVDARKLAEKASAQKSDVLAKISHEIRTPLNAIIGFAEVMAEERFGPIANERYKEYLRDIHQSGGYVISLVNDLLDLAKIEAGKLDLDFASVNLNDIALSAVNLLQPEAQRGRVVLRSGLSPKLPPVVADERSLRQIVLNLLSNAVKFTDAGGQVIVSTALGDQGEAILRVRDTGIGMDDNELALALEPFRQVPTTRRAGGTGLGLPLTKALVEANRAAMAITSVKKEGTLVEITFPPQRVLAG